MAITINKNYKFEFESAARAFESAAGRIKDWRAHHSDPDEQDGKELEGYYRDLERAMEKLRQTIRSYTGADV